MSRALLERHRTTLLWIACAVLGVVCLLGFGILGAVADVLAALAPDPVADQASSAARLVHDVGAQTRGAGPFGGLGAGAAAAGAASGGSDDGGDGDGGDGDGGDEPTGPPDDEDVEC